MAKRRTVLSLVAFFSIAVLAVRAPSQRYLKPPTGMPGVPIEEKPGEPQRMRDQRRESQLNTSTADYFSVSWRSITYSSTIYNPTVSSEDQDHVALNDISSVHNMTIPLPGRGEGRSEYLSLQCEIKILDAKLVLATCQQAIVEQVVDSKGQSIDPCQVQLQPQQMYYEAAKRGPSAGQIRMLLDGRLRNKAHGEITRLKGYFYALVAESLEYMEVPFNPGDGLSSLGRDLPFPVREGVHPGSTELFGAEQRPEMGIFRHGLSVADQVPSRIAMGREFVLRDVRSTRDSVTPTPGTGNATASDLIKGIRYVIAINPTHHKIPFDLEHVPLSCFTDQSSSQTSNSNRPVETPDSKRFQEAALSAKDREPQKTPQQAKLEFNRNLADRFRVSWCSITYGKTAYNPAVSSGVQSEQAVERLLLGCQIKILDPRFVLGTCPEPVIERVVDSKGQSVDPGQQEPRSSRGYYLAPHYRTRQELPSKLARWEGLARLALRLPLKARSMPKRSLELAPGRLRIELDGRLRDEAEGEIRRIKGYFHALLAESFEHVEIPFEPNDQWVRLTPDLEIQVREAVNTGSTYRFDIRQRPAERRFNGGVTIDDYLPGSMVVGQQLIGESLGPTRDFGFLPPMICGFGGGSGRVEKIDYLIAVNPAHHNIPFELEHILLPKP